VLAVLVVASTALVPVAGAGASGGRAPSAPTLLTVDDASAPLSVEGLPQFGWVVNDPDRGEAQSAYQVVVKAVLTGGGVGATVWDSGEVRTPQQSYVTPPGRVAFEPDHAYTWTVRTWDREGKAGPQSRTAHFDTGLGDHDWHAEWIRRPGAERAPFEDFSLLRKDVAIAASPIVRARAYMSAGQQFDLHVNGVRVAHGPSYAYPDEQYYEATDITHELRAGKPNAISVITHWSTPGQGRPASVPAMIARITVDHADGSRQVITSDGSWRAHAGPWIQGTPRNDEGDFVEHIDGRLDPVGWELPGYDDSAWPHAQVLGAHPVAPFLHLFAARSHIVEHPVKPVTFTRVRNGSYVADYGAVIAATPSVDFRAGAAGRAVKIVAGYLKDPDGHVSTTRGVQQTDMHWDYTERAGAQQFRPFDYLGFRYLEVIGAGEPLTRDDVIVYARHASFPDEHAAGFDSSDPTLNKVWNLIRHSALYATQEQFLDTPTREKGAFQDPNTSSATMAAFDDRALTYQALRDVARSQKRYWTDGRVNNVYPNGDGKRDIPDATEQYVDWVWQTYMTTGDLSQIAALYPVVKNISDYVARAIDPKTGLVTNLPGGGSDYLYGLVDWPPQMRYGYDMKTAARTTENVLAVDVFRSAAAMGAALKRPAAERAIEAARAGGVTNAIHARLRRPGGVLVDGLEADDTQSKHASQIANAMALAYGLVPPAQVNAVADHLVQLQNSIGVSTFGYLLSALHAAGRDTAFVAALTDPNRPGYAHILREGATYTWESWDARQIGDSESHAFGSNVLTLMQEDLLGVKVTAPGAARVDVSTPDVTPMRMSGVAVTQRGRIPLAWVRTAPGRFSLDVTIPDNVVATVHIPAAKAAAVSDGHVALGADPGVTAVHSAHGDVAVTLGSGRYRFRVPALPPLPGNRFPWTVAVLGVIAVMALAVLGPTELRRRRRRAVKA
jgi:alpha-L-rhamnosidase